MLWVRAESQETLFADLSQLAARLELPEREAKEQSVIVDAVKVWLDEQERWLLVLDNVEDYGIVRDLARKADAANGTSHDHHHTNAGDGAIGRQTIVSDGARSGRVVASAGRAGCSGLTRARAQCGLQPAGAVPLDDKNNAASAWLKPCLF